MTYNMENKKLVDLSWMPEASRQFLKGGYLVGDETPEKRYTFIAEYLGERSGIKGFEDRVKEYISKKWISFASPEIANLGREKGLPASCNFLELQDTMESIASGEYEMTMLASNGAGTARGFSKIREKGAKYGLNGQSVGVLSWIDSYATKIDKTSQSGMRRGFLTAYLSVEHGEILDFLKIGREGHHIHNITTAVTIPEGWMDSMRKGDKDKQHIFKEIHASRSEVGYPYILFEDNCNKGKHQVYVDEGKWLSMSNICTECVEYTDAEKEFLCVLASANLEFYDDWVNTNFIFDMNIILDIITSEYIEKAKSIKGHEKAVKFAEEHRAIGVGVMGLATYFQKNMIAFGSLEARIVNRSIFKHIREESDRASKWMAKEWGEPKVLVGYGDRNTSRIAIAPTKSSSSLMGFVSQGIEPYKNNYHVKDLAKIMIDWRNPQLESYLENIGKNTEDVWEDILEHGGSVQHLDFLDEDAKDVFKTFTEISQVDIINLASDRQQFIDQSQSLNIIIPSGTKAKDVLKLTILAWEKGIKTLYYQYNINASREKTIELLTCSSCEA